MANCANETMRARTLILVVITASLIAVGCGPDNVVGGKSAADDTTDPTPAVPPPAGPTCTPAFAECSGLCVDLQSDVDNCGVCGNTCNTGEVCSTGKCELICQVGLTNCNGACVNLETDDGNCGTCGNMCLGANTCQAGKCEAPPPPPPVINTGDGICSVTSGEDYTKSPLECPKDGLRCFDATKEGPCADASCTPSCHLVESGICWSPYEDALQKHLGFASADADTITCGGPPKCGSHIPQFIYCGTIGQGNWKLFELQ